MYNDFFGFRESPFTVTPDPRVFYSTPIHQRAYANLLYGICKRKGVVILTGEAGTGKTTILRQLMKNLEHTIRFAFCPYSTLSFEDLLDFVCDDFELQQKPHGRLRQIEALRTFLITQQQHSQYSALLIDEAHNLQPSVLAAFAQLAAFTIEDEVLLPIVLVGQPELEDNLSHPAVASLQARIAISCQLDRLQNSEVGPFIFHRLNAVGCNRHDIFPPDVVQYVATYSQGIPRYINTICDNSLLIACTEEKKIVTVEIVKEVAQDLQLLTTSHIHSEPDSPPYQWETLPSVDVSQQPPPQPAVLATPTLQRVENLLQSASRFFALPPFFTWGGLGMVGLFLLLFFSRPLFLAVTKLGARHGPPPESALVKTILPPTTPPSPSPHPPTNPSSQQKQSSPSAQPNKQSAANLSKPGPREITIATVRNSPGTAELEQKKKNLAPQRDPFAIQLPPEVIKEARPLPPRDDSPQEIKTQRASTIREEKGATPLMLAVMRGHTTVVQELLKNGAEVNEQNASGRTALMLAALAGRNAILQTLIKNGAAVNAKNDEGWTALMYAAWSGHTQTVQTLVRSGAKVDTKNSAGVTALTHAVRNGHHDAARILRTGQARSSIQNLPAKSAVVGALRSRDAHSLALLKRSERR